MFNNNFIYIFKVLIRFCKILLTENFLLSKDVFDFEKNVSQYFGLKYAVGVASGTDALMLSLKAVDVGAGDEVIVPALSFYSTAGAVTWIGATPIFVDVSTETFSIDHSIVEEKITAKTKAIIVAHLNGVVTDILPLIEIAKKHNLLLIEDYAQSFGSFFINKHKERVYGDIICLSLSARKIFHGGGDGGAIITNNKNFFEKLRLMRMYGANVKDLGLSHCVQGVASRLGVWNAVILNLSFNRVKYPLYKRRKIFFLYLKLLEKSNELILPVVALNKNLIINGYRFVILVKRRDELLIFLKNHKVDTKINYGQILPLMPAFSYLGYLPGEFPVAERIARESLTLPTNESLTYKEIEKIVKLINSFIKN